MFSESNRGKPGFLFFSLPHLTQDGKRSPTPRPGHQQPGAALRLIGRFPPAGGAREAAGTACRLTSDRVQEDPENGTAPVFRDPEEASGMLSEMRGNKGDLLYTLDI